MNQTRLRLLVERNGSERAAVLEQLRFLVPGQMFSVCILSGGALSVAYCGGPGLPPSEYPRGTVTFTDQVAEVTVEFETAGTTTLAALIPYWAYEEINRLASSVTYFNTRLVLACCIAAQFQVGDRWVRTPGDELKLSIAQITGEAVQSLKQGLARLDTEMIERHGPRFEAPYLVD